MGMWLIQKPGPGKILKLEKKSHGKNMTFGSGEMQSHGVSLKTDAKNPTHDPFIPISIIYRQMAKKVMALEISKVLQGMVIFAKNVLRFIFMMKSWPWKSAKCFKEWSFS